MCEQEAAGVCAQESLFCSFISGVFISIPVRRGCEEFGACRPRFKSAASFYFICDHGVQLINLILSFSVKIRGLINSRITERIKWKCAKFLAWCICSDYSTIKFLSLSLSPNFSSLLLHQQWNSRTMSVSAGQGGESWKCQKETYKTLNVSIYSFKPNENLAMPFRMCLGKLCTLIWPPESAPISSLTPSFILTMH